VTHSDPFDLLRRALAASDRQLAEPPTPDCLDDNTVAALAEGSLDAAARAAAMVHLAGCPRCVTAVASVARALADPRVSREVAGAEGRGRHRFYRIALPMAAAAILIILALPRRTGDSGAIHRAPTLTATAAPAPMSPVGVVAEPELLRWASVAGADRYRVTLFDAESRVLYEKELTDTVAAIPDSIRFSAGRPYLWKVEARTGWDRWVASSLVEFHVAGTPR
jgi:hypothetical protein